METVCMVGDICWSAGRLWGSFRRNGVVKIVAVVLRAYLGGSYVFLDNAFDGSRFSSGEVGVFVGKLRMCALPTPQFGTEVHKTSQRPKKK